MKKPIEPIDKEIAQVKVQNFVSDFDRAMKKEIKHSLKALLIIGGPFLLCIGGYFITSNLVILFAGFGYAMTGALINSLIEEKIINRSKKGNIISIDSLNGREKDVEEVLKNSIIIDKTAVDNFRKDAANKIIDTDPKINAPISTINDNTLSKEETMEQIFREIGVYYYAYELPPQEITEKDWDTYFEICYQYFQNKGLENNFYVYMSKIVKQSLARVKVNGKKSINIHDYIYDLNQLELIGFTKEEISAIRKEISSSITQAEIIDINKAAEDRKNK